MSGTIYLPTEQSAPSQQAPLSGTEPGAITPREQAVPVPVVVAEVVLTLVVASAFDDRFRDIVGFSSDEYTVGTLWFGTALQQPSPPMKKLALDDVLKRTE